MARPALFSEEEISRAHELRDRATTVSEMQKALSVLLMAEAHLDAEKTAEILGISHRSVFRNRKTVRVQEGLSRSSWGGRRRAFLTVAEEEAFLAPWLQRAREGGVLTVPPIHAALVEKLGRPIPASTTYRLLARHGWRKVMPDTKHPKSNQDDQDDFKKNSRNGWIPPATPTQKGVLSD